jgi:alanine-glyoxylate transaminase/serine-glyoxylate transaminase/serine-pyruvate transaminase
MPGRTLLFIPGPTNVPDEFLRAMDRAMEDHRGSHFPAFVHGILHDLKSVFGTTAGRAFVFAASGSAMWDAALVNTLDVGDRVLAVRKGQFSTLFADAAVRLGYRVDTIDVEWGEATPPDAVEAALRADTAHGIKAVLMVHNETATGVTSDVAAIRRAIDAAGHPSLLFVDGVSSIASLRFELDAWGVDAAITGSQKGFMLPPGLGLLCLSPKALARVPHATSPRAFFDLRALSASNDTGYFPYTPPLPLLHGLRASLDRILADGMPAIIARHHRHAEAVRAAVAAWGLPLVAARPEIVSDTVTAVRVPEGISSATVMDIAARRYNVALGSGLARLSGKVFRIGHLGAIDDWMIVGGLGAVEMALTDAGVALTLGSGVAAAADILRRTAPPLPSPIA